MPELSEAAVRWVETATAKSVVSSEQLPGGRSGAVYQCWLSDGSSIVVRHGDPFGEGGSVVDGPVARETTALCLLGNSSLPVPSVVSSDVGLGFLATTFLPGEMLMNAEDLRHRIDSIADLALRIASHELTPDHGLREWESWAPQNPVAPHWGDTGLWNEAIRVYNEIRPSVATPRLIHRDLHPGNILWEGLSVSGVVDWVNACVGHPHAELGHCRWNLSCLIDADAAERFLQRYLDESDTGSYDRWWDLSCALSFLPGPIEPGGWVDGGRPDLTAELIVQRTESFIERALNR